jgi:hypothetical protein
MTTSEPARAWAKAEAEKRYGVAALGLPDGDGFDEFQAGILHVLSLLESETAVEAAALAFWDAYSARIRNRKGSHSTTKHEADDANRAGFRAALAAVVAAITKGGSGNG